MAVKPTKTKRRLLYKVGKVVKSLKDKDLANLEDKDSKKNKTLRQTHPLASEDFLSSFLPEKMALTFLSKPF